MPHRPGHGPDGPDKRRRIPVDTMSTAGAGMGNQILSDIGRSPYADTLLSVLGSYGVPTDSVRFRTHGDPGQYSTGMARVSKDSPYEVSMHVNTPRGIEEGVYKNRKGDPVRGTESVINHELGHVIQNQTGSQGSDPGYMNPREREAHRMDAVLQMLREVKHMDDPTMGSVISGALERYKSMVEGDPRMGAVNPHTARRDFKDKFRHLEDSGVMTGVRRRGPLEWIADKFGLGGEDQ